MDLTPAPAATPEQVRLLLIRFAELGYSARSSRAERLAVAAAALGDDELGSFADLNRSQAGRLFGCLRHGSIPEAGTGMVLHEGWSGPAADTARPDPEPARDTAGPDLLCRTAILLAVAVLCLREIRRQQRRDLDGSSALAGAS